MEVGVAEGVVVGKKLDVEVSVAIEGIEMECENT